MTQTNRTMRAADKGDERYAFVHGFRYGQEHGPASPREAEAWLREWNPAVYVSTGCVDAFCNGSEDGARGDTFRLDLVPAWQQNRADALTCPRCREARAQVAAKGFRVSVAADHGDDFCAAQSVETFGPATYGHPKAYVQIRTEGGAL